MKLLLNKKLVKTTNPTASLYAVKSATKHRAMEGTVCYF
jgi:hypothetical protein